MKLALEGKNGSVSLKQAITSCHTNQYSAIKKGPDRYKSSLKQKNPK